MGVIGNNFRLNTGSHRSVGEVMARTNGNAQRYSSFCNTRSQMANTTVYSRVATPLGSNPQSSFYPPQAAGGMALRSISNSSLTATLIPELLMDVDFTGSGNLDATASLTIAMLCAMTGNGTLTADIVGLLNASVNFTGNGDLSADVKGVGNMIIDMLGSGDLDATIAAYGNMSIDIVVTGTGLTTSNVGQAVWSVLAANNNVPLTMGAKLNSAASAGDPWSTILPGSYTGDEAGKIVADLETLIKQVKALTAANL
jgi:hypothetical protein